MEVRFQLRDTGETVMVNPKATAISVTLDGIPVYSFDLEGRLLHAFDGRRTLLRGLDNRVLDKRTEPSAAGPRRVRRALDEPERARTLSQIHGQMERARRAFEAAAVTFRDLTPPEEDLQAVRSCLARIARHDAAALAESGRRFAEIYGRVSILPPDQYYALVLQATEGCPYRRCTFCTFYRGRRFRVKTEEEFAAHLQAVRAFFGEGIRLRRSIFLGDANALVAPRERLLGALDQAHEVFPALGAVYAFMDVFTGWEKPKELGGLADRGLRRVYLGVETGHDPLLAFLRKPGRSAKTRRVVRAVKDGHLHVALILLLGAGGDRYGQAHVEDTARLLNELPLGRGDLVYFSPLVAAPGSEYARRAAAAGVRTLSEEEMEEQEAAIRARLTFAPESGPKISRYDIREFVY